VKAREGSIRYSREIFDIGWTWVNTEGEFCVRKSSNENEREKFIQLLWKGNYLLDRTSTGLRIVRIVVSGERIGSIIFIFDRRPLMFSRGRSWCGRVGTRHGISESVLVLSMSRTRLIYGAGGISHLLLRRSRMMVARRGRVWGRHGLGIMSGVACLHLSRR
jgi:hypothetical protein